MQLEKEEQAQKSRYARPGSVRSFQSEIEEDKAARDLLLDQYRVFWKILDNRIIQISLEKSR
jgi:hypothetical protein